MTPRYSAPAAAPERSGSPAAAGNGPIKTLRIGRIKAAVWQNTSEKGTFFNVSFARMYVDEQKQFHDVDSFGRDDLLVLSKLADQAHTFVCERMAAQKSDEAG